MNWGGLVAILGFYLLFFGVGAWASRKRTEGADEFLLAGRSLPVLLGILTMVATWVGGGYLNGTAEAMADPVRGMVWAQAPWGYALSLVVGGLFFAGRMRRLGFRTLLDLFEYRYGQRVAAFLFIPNLLGDVFWSAAILVALGTTSGVVLGIDFTFAILISAGVAITYTCMGGLRSVVYTDALQIVFIVVGLLVAAGFALDTMGGMEAVSAAYVQRFGDAAQLVPSASAWEGPAPWGWQWMDIGLLLVLGGIPWQVYFQRVLACRDARTAVRLSVFAGFACLIPAAPAALIGAIGGVADWSLLGLEAPPNPALTLPWVLRHLTPPVVATVGLAAIAAAVMSSIDSSILSTSSMFAWNVYRPLLGQKVHESSVPRVTRLGVIGFGGMTALLALKVQSVYTLWALCSDLIFVVTFPQLVLALFVRRTNSLGACAGILTSLILRLGGGEPMLGIPTLLPYPLQDPELGILFPFRTFAMLSGVTVTLLVSDLSQRLGRAGASPFPQALDGEGESRG